MNDSRSIGRVGGLAVALGIGTAISTGCAIAAADAAGSGTQESPDSSVSGSPAPGAARTGPARASKPTAAEARTVRDSVPGAGAARRSGNRPVPVSADAIPGLGASSLAVVSRSATAVVSPSSVPDPNALPPRPSLLVLGVTAISTTASLVVAVAQQITIALHLGATNPATNQAIEFNGYDLVPSSTELVTSVYGPWTYGPGGLNQVQGVRRYDVVDPATQQTLGTFRALVSTGTPLGVRNRYVELLVTSTEGDVSGVVPPVGSVIAGMQLIGRFGWTYSAVPSASGDVVRFEITTPLGNIPIPLSFDAAQGIADGTVDNRPVDLGNGYSIAPSDPAGQIYTGTSGFLPVFQTVQARQDFDIRDSSGATVGRFGGVLTTTWDVLGAYTQAILVTDSYGADTGTAVGQVPPVGTVYNVAYTGSDAHYVLYTSMPSSSGDVISLIEGNNGDVSNVLTFPVNGLDASAPPVVKRLPFAGGSGLLPTSALVPFGVNGLPPRDVQVQGYQQFAVYDRTGVQQGSFDAIVTYQWDLLGIYSRAIVVTNVSEGTAGTAPGDVPPVGSVFNYVYAGNTGFGISYWSLPSSSGARISYKLLTPLIDIPTWSTYNASAGLTGVTFFDPFRAA